MGSGLLDSGCHGVTSFQKIYGLYSVEHHKVERIDHLFTQHCLQYHFTIWVNTNASNGRKYCFICSGILASMPITRCCPTPELGRGANGGGNKQKSVQGIRKSSFTLDSLWKRERGLVLDRRSTIGWSDRKGVQDWLKTWEQMSLHSHSTRFTT